MQLSSTAPLRRIARRIRNVFVPGVVVLLYHRVAELPRDPQLLCVSPNHFAEHLEVLRTYGKAIQVKALNHLLETGRRGESGIIVTFDDGYADNLYNAKPLLERYNIPATVFVTSGYVGADREFWHDELEKLLLHPGPLPEKLRLSINQQTFEWELDALPGSDACDGYPSDWNVLLEEDPTPRHRVYRRLCEILQPFPDDHRRRVLDQIAALAEMDTKQRQTHRTLSPQELIRLADGNLVEIGAHTVSHPMLSALAADAQTAEIHRSKARLEEILGAPVATFAYPFGGRSDYTEHTVVAVRQAGFDFACSNFPGVVRPGSDPWQLPRFLVRDWDGDQFARNLEAWINN
jgi:peptidoglycan/xylan/chitin deacetylase (PgdA/CDA1 family)